MTPTSSATHYHVNAYRSEGETWTVEALDNNRAYSTISGAQGRANAWWGEPGRRTVLCHASVADCSSSVCEANP